MQQGQHGCHQMICCPSCSLTAELIQKRPTSYCVATDVTALLKKARGKTDTGILKDELPPPTGYVAGLHPIRPGQPKCPHFLKFGECAYNQQCVYNHPGKPSSDQHRQQPPPTLTPARLQHDTGTSINSTSTHTSANSSSCSISAGQAASHGRTPAQQPLKVAWGGAGTSQHGAQAFQKEEQQSAGSTGAQPPSALAPPNPAIQPWAVPAPQGGAPTAHSSVLTAAGAPSTHADLGQMQLAGAHLAHAQGCNEPVRQPCHMLLLRGFCPMGDKCPYAHTPPKPAGQQAPSATVPVGPIITTASMSTSYNAAQYEQGPSPLAAAAEPATPAAAATLGAPHSATPGSVAASTHTPAVAPRKWADLLSAPRSAEQQQQQQQQQEQEQEQPPPVQSASSGRSVMGSGVNNGMSAVQDAKLLGWTEGNLPQLRGQPCCSFFMGIGSCKFKTQCIYHHPQHADHPECVMRGVLPPRYNAANNPSYARLVNHLYRLWDNDSCVEAQLKIWLAWHLLNRNNPDAQMFSGSASKPAAHPKGRGFFWQPLGPYTCSLGEAGEVLHHMWRAQPDRAAIEGMPYTKALRELLAGDPFFGVTADKKCSSHYWVRLNVDKVKSMLNV